MSLKANKKRRVLEDEQDAPAPEPEPEPESDQSDLDEDPEDLGDLDDGVEKVSDAQDRMKMRIPKKSKLVLPGQELALQVEATAFRAQVDFLKDAKLGSLQELTDAGKTKDWLDKALVQVNLHAGITTQALLCYISDAVRQGLALLEECETLLGGTESRKWEEMPALAFLQALKVMLRVGVGQDMGVMAKPDELIARLHRTLRPGFSSYDGTSQQQMLAFVVAHVTLVNESNVATQFAAEESAGRLTGLILKSAKKNLGGTLWRTIVKDLCEAKRITEEALSEKKYKDFFSEVLQLTAKWEAMTKGAARLGQLRAQALKEHAEAESSGPQKKRSFEAAPKEKPHRGPSEGSGPQSKKPRSGDGLQGGGGQCKICGLTHSGKPCGDAWHPDRNKSTASWPDSDAGKRWAKHGQTCLYFAKRFSPSGELVDFPKEERERYKKQQRQQKCKLADACLCTAIGQKDLDKQFSRDTRVVDDDRVHTGSEVQAPRIEIEDCLIQVRLRVRTAHSRLVEMKDVCVLLDTGAINVNTVSCRMRDRIKEAGGVIKPCHKEIRVAGKVIVAAECVHACVTVNNHRSWHTGSICSEFYVTQHTADLIIGRPTLDRSPMLKEALFSSLVKVEDLPWLWQQLQGLESQCGEQAKQRLAEIEEKFQGLDKGREELHAQEAASNDDDLPQKVNGTTEEIEAQMNLVREFRDIFSRKLRKEAARVPPMHLKVDREQWERRENQRGPRPRSRGQAEEIDLQTGEMLKAEVIRLSQAGAYSQVLLTRKPDGTWRFCIDYRRLNDATEAEKWPIPDIPAMLRNIGRNKPGYFGVLDLTKGYYQTPLAEGSAKYTAFITSSGLYEWRRVPMGLKGAPGYFQRTMTTLVLAGLVGVTCAVYMDDLIVYGRSFEEYMRNLREVLMRLRKFGLTANPEKTKLGMKRVEYVGHVIDSEGVSFSEERIREIVDFPLPKTKGELKSFLGMANYVRGTMQDASEYTVPLTAMLAGYSKKQRSLKIEWTPAQKEAWERYKDLVNKAQKIFYADDKSPIDLFTDASNVGIGAHLVQTLPNSEVRTIGLFSRTLTETQRRWSVPERECFAIVEALKHFAYILRDVRFRLHVDHKNLVYIRDTGSMKVTAWKVLVQEHDFEPCYIQGEKNIVADALSRIQNSPKADECEGEYVQTDLKGIPEPAELGVREVWDGIVGDEHYRLIQAVHNEAVGHLGAKETVRRLKSQGHGWPFMRAMVRKFIQDCDSCQKDVVKELDIAVAKFSLHGDGLMAKRSIDFIGPLAKTEEGFQYIITVVDHFSKWVELYPAHEATAAEAARALYEHYSRFGVPKELTSDRGAAFVNELIQQFNKRVGVTHTLSTAYSHEENGQVERANKEINRFIADVLYNRKKKENRWHEDLPAVRRILNTKMKGNTGFSPAYIIYAGALDLDKELFQQAGMEAKKTPLNREDWSEWLEARQKLQEAVATKVKLLLEEQQKIKVLADTGIRTEFPVGSLVLKRSPEGKAEKFGKRWQGPYRVTGINNQSYQLLDIGNGKTLPWCNIHLLREYNHDARRVDPVEVKLKDSATTYLVDSIWAHELPKNWNKKSVSGIKFLVKWKGWEEPTWQYWADMRDNVLVHEYLRAQGLERLILRKFIKN